MRRRALKFVTEEIYIQKKNNKNLVTIIKHNIEDDTSKHDDSPNMLIPIFPLKMNFFVFFVCCLEF